MEAREQLQPLMAAARTAEAMEALAQELRLVAEELERRAEAARRVGHVVRGEQIREHARQRTGPGTKGGRPKGTGARFVRWEAPRGTGKASRRSGMLYIGRALWQELGEPKRMDVQRLGGELHIRPCAGDAGWAISRAEQTMPRLNIGEGPADALGLVEGRMPAVIRAGAIVADISQVLTKN